MKKFCCALGLLLSSALIAQTTWNGNGGDNNWGTGANWVGGSSPSPGTTSDLIFAGTNRLTSNNNYNAFDDFRDITFNSTAGSFTLTGSAIDLFGKIENGSANAQTVSFSAIALNSASANQFNPVSGNLTITSANIFTNSNFLNVFGNNGNTLTFGPSAVISQGGGLAIQQNSTVIFQAAQTYTGQTQINAGTLSVASGGSIASGSGIFLGNGGATGTSASLVLSAASGGQTFSNLVNVNPGNGTNRLLGGTNTSGTNEFSGQVKMDGSPGENRSVTFVAGSGGTTLISGQVTGAGQNIRVSAAGGTVRLTNNTNSFTGSTTITSNGGTLQAGVGTLVSTSSVTINAGGTLLLDGNGRHLGNATAVNLAGGTFGTGGFSEPGTAGQNIGPVTLSASSVLNLGAGASILNFAASNNQAWAAGAVLQILNWTGNAVNSLLGNGADQVIFGSGITSLTAAQLLQIQFVNPSGLAPGTYVAVFGPDLDGEIVPGAQVPEPATVIGGLLAFGALGWTQRRRLRAWLPARS